jgi:hypothetical protein
MSEQPLNSRSAVQRAAEIEALARETGAPVHRVQEIYEVEYDKLDRSARIKTFVPVLAHRHIRTLLQVERGKAENA